MSQHRRRRLLAGFALIDLAITIAVLVTFVGAPAFDATLVREAAAWRDGAVGAVMDAASDYGYGMWLVPISILLAVALVAASDRRGALVVGLSTAIAVVVTRVLKETFERARPEGAPEAVAGFSMPSGHATSAAAFATSLLLALPATPRWHVVRALLVLGALVVAASRVVLGVHYPTDVAAGLCSGASVALLVSVAIDRAR